MRNELLLFAVTLVTGTSTVTAQEFQQPDYPQAQYDWMKTTTATNLDQVAASVGFSNRKSDPYNGYGDTIISDENCYVVFPSETNRQEYQLVTSTPGPMEAANVTSQGYGTHFLTHETPCGVCSDLKNLAVYLEVTDLTNPVRNCGLRLTQNGAIDCLEDIGFTSYCTWIWYWNTQNTRKTLGNKGCLGTCLVHISSPNVIEKEEGGGNPCDPSNCPNTINGEPVCSPDQYEDGPYRLNPCLQCDECRSGPVFQKVSGRTRRASGIPSAIPRPPGDVSEVLHFYNRPPTPSPTPAPTPAPTQRRRSRFGRWLAGLFGGLFVAFVFVRSRNAKKQSELPEASVVAPAEAMGEDDDNSNGPQEPQSVTAKAELDKSMEEML